MSVCDASSSWSGYQYQGKITIYIALQLINKCVKNPIGMDIGKYFIEVECREDLAIKKEDEYISFHQVKARKYDIYMNNYLEAIEKLYDEKIKSPNADIFLHTVVNIKDWGEEKYKDLYKSKIEKGIGEINLIEEEKSNLTDAKTIKEKDEKTNKIQDEIKYNQSKYNESHKINSIILYKYGDKNDKFCTLEDINVYIEDEIKKYLLYTKQNEKLGNIDVAYNKLVCYMDEYIKKRHVGEVKEYFAVEDIKNLLDTRYLDRDRLFHLSKIKDIYCSISIDNYCSYFCDMKEECSVEYFECKIYKVIEHLLNIDLEDLEKIIMKFNPHVLIKDWEYDGRNFVKEEGLYFLYKTIISYIEKEVLISDTVVKYDKAALSYLPTTINVCSDGLKKSAIERYKKAIINNEFLLNELFEDNVFITENLVSENLLESINDVDEVDDILAKKQEEYNGKSYLVNQIRFKDIEMVTEEINND
ncbi:ABC-three component system protein [Clostridium akagii]|uniref:ABC-three component system protein n=1 Tax=Clostridium akagii TaxID=91623 RepID=UPI00047B1839|nr:ABC-three component system protein [Clostridium akagii]